MAHKNTPKVTPATAEMNYEKLITDKAKEYAPMIKEAFPTQSSLLIAVDNSVRFLDTAFDALNGEVTADYFCKHGPLAQYPDQLFTLMVLFVDSGVFYPTDPEKTVFNLENADTWKFAGKPKQSETAEAK